MVNLFALVLILYAQIIAATLPTPSRRPCTQQSDLRCPPMTGFCPAAPLPNNCKDGCKFPELCCPDLNLNTWTCELKCKRGSPEKAMRLSINSAHTSTSSLRNLFLWSVLCCLLCHLTLASKCQIDDLRCPTVRHNRNCSSKSVKCKSDSDCEESSFELCCPDPQNPCLISCLKGQPETATRCPPPKIDYHTCELWQKNETCSSKKPCSNDQSCCPGPQNNCQMNCQTSQMFPKCDLDD